MGAREEEEEEEDRERRSERRSNAARRSCYFRRAGSPWRRRRRRARERFSSLVTTGRRCCRRLGGAPIAWWRRVGIAVPSDIGASSRLEFCELPKREFSLFSLYKKKLETRCSRQGAGSSSSALLQLLLALPGPPLSQSAACEATRRSAPPLLAHFRFRELGNRRRRRRRRIKFDKPLLSPPSPLPLPRLPPQAT